MATYQFNQQKHECFREKRITRSIPIAEKLAKELAEYQVFCQQYFDNLSEYVFTDNQNKPLTRNAVQCIFKRLKDIMNFKNVRLSSHTFDTPSLIDV